MIRIPDPLLLATWSNRDVPDFLSSVNLASLSAQRSSFNQRSGGCSSPKYPKGWCIGHALSRMMVLVSILLGWRGPHSRSVSLCWVLSPRDR